MKIISIIVFLFSITDANALIYFEISGGIGAGDISITDSSGTVYRHEGFVLEADSNVRLGLDVGPLSFGGLFNMGQFNSSFTRSDKTVSLISGDEYETSYDHQYAGGFVGLNIPNTPIRIWGEYYFSSEILVHYAQNDPANIFSKEDKFTGKGYGGGLGYQINETLYTYLFYRAINFDNWTVKASGISTNLPSTNYSTLDLSQIMFGITYFASWL
jgi:hypothetical protein